MHRAAVRLLLPLALLAVSAGAAAQTVLPREARERILQAVVQVVAYDPVGDATLGSGSGTIVSEDGWVLTNFHVLDAGGGTAVPWAAIFVTDPAAPDREPTFRYWARYEAGDPERDLALLRIVEDADENPLPAGTRFVAAPLGDSTALIPGDAITVVGYPGISGATITFTSGIVSGFLGEDLRAGGKQWIKTDAKLARGNSGGGAFDREGRLVGVPTLARQASGGAWLESQEYLRPIALAWPLLSRHVAGLERVGGVGDRLAGDEDEAVPAWPSPLDVAREGASRAGAAATPSPSPAASSGARRGALEAGDAQLDSGEYLDVFAYEAKAGTPVSIEVSSDAIDPYLVVFDPRDEVVLEVDDSAGAGLDVRESFLPRMDGVFLLAVTSAFPGEVGPYELRVAGARPADDDAAADGGGGDFRAPVSRGAESGFAGVLDRGAPVLAEIAAHPEGAYHTYRIDVPPGTAELTIRMEADADLDLFVKHGSEIASLAEDGDWDHRDIELAHDAVLRIRAPAAGPWFVDVVWLVGAEGETARYSVRAD